MSRSHSRLLTAIACALCLLATSSCGSRRDTARTAYTGSHRPQAAATDAPQGDPPADKRAGRIVAEARKWLGTPYVYGGHDQSGTDCSGLTMEVFMRGASLKLPRTARDQRVYCREVGRDDLAVGDLLFFTSDRSSGKVAHVGLYIGNQMMIHASSSRGVIESSITTNYYISHWAGAGRIPAFCDAVPPAAGDMATQEQTPPEPPSVPAAPRTSPEPPAEATVQKAVTAVATAAVTEATVQPKPADVVRQAFTASTFTQK